MKIKETAKPKKLRKLLAILVAMGLMSFAGVNVASADDYPITDTTSLNTFLGQGTYFSGKVKNDFDLDNYITERYIAGTTTIDGGNFTISGDNTYSGFLFSDSSATETTIKNLTIKQMSGGAIWNGKNGALSIDHVTFNNNYTTDASGGAIYNAGGTEETPVSITNSTFYGNYTVLGGEEPEPEPEIGEDSMEDAGGSNSSPIGGAIYNASNSYMNISDSNFEGNGYKDYGLKATESTQYGGAIYNEGNLTLSGNSFTTNVATSDGGAIYNKDGATITLSGTNTFTSNSVLNNNGGAIYNGNGATITLSGTNTFTANNASNNGGAIYNEGDMSISGATFGGDNASDGNTAYSGGAIYNSGGTSETPVSISNTTFKNNYTSDGSGGAIYNDGGTISLTGTNTFKNNKASNSSGGAIYISGTMTSSGTNTFENNSAQAGGAIYNQMGTINLSGENTFTGNKATSGNGGAINSYSGTVTLTGTNTFESNTATGNGGAINGEFATINLSGTKTFKSNSASSGGAIYYFGNTATISDTSTFENNTATSNGGAIYNSSTFSLTDANTFKSNSASNGGAIYNSGTFNIANGTFKSNTATSDGGAIYNGGGTITLTSTNTFESNSASNGGAIYIDSGTFDISNGTFKSNTATSDGGAIYNRGEINLTGTNTFTDNTANGTPNDIYNDYDLYIKDGTTTMDGGITGSNGYTYLHGGTLVLGQNATFEQYTLNFNGGSLDLRNTTIQTLNFNDLYLTGTNNNIYVDADLAKGQMDTLNATNIFGDPSTGDIGTLNVAGITLLSDATADETKIQFTSTADLMSHVTYSGGQVAYSPIYKYDVNYDNTTGNFTFARLGGGGGGGDDPEIYNPAILPSPVSSQVAGYTTMVENFNQGFNFVDNFMGMTKAERMAYRDRNKYALLDHTPQYTGNASKSLWVMPYTSFENVKLDNGPDIDAITYGTYFGGDSELYSLKHGWEAVYSLFAGYNGAYQTFGGVNMNYNGGSLGAAATFFKGNFFTAIDVAVGGGVSTANTMFGMENSTMLSAGGALKAGYNFEFKEGRHIIQPSLLVGYSFTNTFDYTNAVGIDITSDPLHAIIIQPQIKYIMNLKNGWQPYAAVSMVFNIMDKSRFYAQDIALPEMSMRPYVQYGLGLQKTWGERCTGYVQAMVRNGGRNGVALSLGFKWQLGKGGRNNSL